MLGHNGEHNLGGRAAGRDEWWDITESTVMAEGK